MYTAHMDQESPSTEEVLINQWQQPTRAQQINLGKATLLALPVLAALAALAWWQKNLNFALVGAVVAAALVTLRSQNKAGALEITLTNQRIIIGRRGYPLSGYVGYWLGEADGAIEINLETEKPQLLPTTFLYANNSMEEARSVMGQILTEMEPRERKLSDKAASYFRF
jgi:hypothetical protein